jgi:hypothetical protein
MDLYTLAMTSIVFMLSSLVIMPYSLVMFVKTNYEDFRFVGALSFGLVLFLTSLSITG